MDLICIRRKYRNIRKIIIFSFIITIFVYAVLAINHVYAVERKQKIFDEDLTKISKFLEENELQEEEVYEPKVLTNKEIETIKKIYKSEEKRVFLTFDDGPSKKVTVPILNLLREENIKANFFVLGSRVDLYPDIVKRAYEEGHYIANHGYSHKYSKIYNSSNSVLKEYNKTNKSIREAIGNKLYNSNIFRFPGGSIGGTYNEIKAEAKKLLEQKHIASVDWNALNGDAEGLKTVGKLIDRLKETAQNKNSIVILMHDAADKTQTYEMLPEAINYLRQEGYIFKTFYDILD